MNSSNENLGKLILVGVLLLGGLGYVGYTMFWVPMAEAAEESERLQDEIARKQAEIAAVHRDRKKLEMWRALSLPGVENMQAPAGKTPVGPKMTPEQAREAAAQSAQQNYIDWLRGLVHKHSIKNADPVRVGIDMKATPHVVNGVPVYSVLTFSINAPEAKLADVTAFLREFQATPLLHRVRSLTIKKIESAKAAPEMVTAKLTIEALIVNGSRKRGDTLQSPPNLIALNQPAKTLETAMMAVRRRPSALGVGFIPWVEIFGLATMAPNRKYEDIPKKNIFEGALPPPPPVKKDTTPSAWAFGPDRSWLPKAPVIVARPTPDLVSFVHLTDVTASSGAPPWASVYSRATEKLLKVRVEPGADTIPLVVSGEDRAVVHGKVLHIDPRGLVFRVALAAEAPEESPRNRFTNSKAIYSLAKEDVSDLVKLGTIKPAQADRTFKMHRAFWDGLVNDKVVTLSDKGKTFTFRWDLVTGQVSRADDNWVVITLPEKYCSFAAPEDDEAVRLHAGYCYFSLGESLVDALETPWEWTQVEGLLAAANRKE